MAKFQLSLIRPESYENAIADTRKGTETYSQGRGGRKYAPFHGESHLKWASADLKIKFWNSHELRASHIGEALQLSSAEGWHQGQKGLC